MKFTTKVKILIFVQKLLGLYMHPSRYFIREEKQVEIIRFEYMVSHGVLKQTKIDKKDEIDLVKHKIAIKIGEELYANNAIKFNQETEYVPELSENFEKITGSLNFIRQ